MGLRVGLEWLAMFRSEMKLGFCSGKPLTTFWTFLSSETKTKIVLSRLRVPIGKGGSKWSAEGKEDGWREGERIKQEAESTYQSVIH